MEDVVIVSAVRTPIGKWGGALSSVRPDDLAAIAIEAAVERAGIDPLSIDQVYMGCANQAGEDNRNVARMASLLAGLPQSVPGVTLNRLCASGLNAVNQGARAIRAGEESIVVAGGVESMTRAPYSMRKNSRAFGPPGHQELFDTTLGWRFQNPKMAAMFPLEAMGETAENIYEMSARGEIPGGAITREQQDAYALQSHARAVDAINAGRFDAEIVPVSIPQRKGDPLVFGRDEHPRYIDQEDGSVALATDMSKMARLNPIFRDGGTVTAANASGLNDGASALVLMSASRARELGITPLAKWLGSQAAGVDPRVMGTGPVPATEKLLRRLGVDADELDLVELNEAFAVQSIAVLRMLGISEDITNVNGGAIALGHPLGCSGARILTTLVHEMNRRVEDGQSVRKALATLCVGVGQGESTLIEPITED